MPIFELREVELIQAKQEFDELVLDGIGQLDSFERLIETKHKRYKTEYEMLVRYMEYVANGNSLPDTKFKDVTPIGESVKEYEFKSKLSLSICACTPSKSLTAKSSFLVGLRQHKGPILNDLGH